MNTIRHKGSFGTAAYGGDNWSPREASHAQEIGHIWAGCGIDSEWRRLESVLLHCPGEELNAAQEEHEAVQMLGAIDLGKPSPSGRDVGDGLCR